MYEDLIGPATSTTTAAGVPSSATNPTMTQFPTYLEAATTAGEEEETSRKTATTTTTTTTATTATADSGVDMSTVGTTSSSSSVCQYAQSSASSSSAAVANADDFMLIGPFLCALLNRLDHMLSNSLQINFLVTGIFARLAYYPQILLRSFLLNNSLVLQPNVKSLIQVNIFLNCKYNSLIKSS